MTSKTRAGMKVIDRNSRESFDPGETVILKERHEAQLIISLLIERRGLEPEIKIFSEAPVICGRETMLTAGEVIDFDFLFVEKTIRNKGDHKTANSYKAIRNKYKEVLSTKRYKIIGQCIPNILFIRPVPPPPTIFFGKM